MTDVSCWQTRRIIDRTICAFTMLHETRISTHYTEGQQTVLLGWSSGCIFMISIQADNIGMKFGFFEACWSKKFQGGKLLSISTCRWLDQHVRHPSCAHSKTIFRGKTFESSTDDTDATAYSWPRPFILSIKIQKSCYSHQSRLRRMMSHDTMNTEKNGIDTLTMVTIKRIFTWRTSDFIASICQIIRRLQIAGWTKGIPELRLQLLVKRRMFFDIGLRPRTREDLRSIILGKLKPRRQNAKFQQETYEKTLEGYNVCCVDLRIMNTCSRCCFVHMDILVYIYTSYTSELGQPVLDQYFWSEICHMQHDIPATQCTIKSLLPNFMIWEKSTTTNPTTNPTTNRRRMQGAWYKSCLCKTCQFSVTKDISGCKASSRSVHCVITRHLPWCKVLFTAVFHFSRVWVFKWFCWSFAVHFCQVPALCDCPKSKWARAISGTEH